MEKMGNASSKHLFYFLPKPPTHLFPLQKEKKSGGGGGGGHRLLLMHSFKRPLTSPPPPPPPPQIALGVLVTKRQSDWLAT